MAIKFSKKSGDRFKLYSMCFAEAVYHIWLQRNEMVFNQKCRPEATVVREVLFKVACRATDKQRHMLIL